MKIIVQSFFDQTSIRHRLGQAEYSYYFVQSAYLPVLETLGTVAHANSHVEIDAIHAACEAVGEPCVFLCFQPPYHVPLTLRCPTIPVFAWEFTTIPCERLDDDQRSDWRHVFAHCGRAITLSTETASLVRDAMGEDFPVLAIPTPTYDRFAAIGPREESKRTIEFRGHVFDSAASARFETSRVWPHEPHPVFPPVVAVPAAPAPEPIPEPIPAPPPPAIAIDEPSRKKSVRARLSLTFYYAVSWYRDVIRDILPAPVKTAMSLAGRAGYRAYRLALPLPLPPAPLPSPAPIAEAIPSSALPPAILPPPLPEASLTLNGVVYVSVLSPQDGRKNWTDMVSGFVWALRDRPDATLIVKMPVKDASTGFHDHFDGWVQQLAPFRCRIIAMYAFLDDTEYEQLIRAADFYVNTSSAEGLCLPLMEFLSAGRPALAPDHSAMADYLTPENAYILASSPEHNVWPQDPRELYTTMRHRLNWQSLADAYQASHTLATEAGGGYQAMAQRARETMRDFCAAAIVREKLREILQALPSARPSPSPEAFEQAEAAE
jgi:glycosyltransferase involved in cell wall biosynthesis